MVGCRQFRGAVGDAFFQFLICPLDRFFGKFGLSYISANAERPYAPPPTSRMIILVVDTQCDVPSSSFACSTLPTIGFPVFRIAFSSSNELTCVVRIVKL